MIKVTRSEQYQRLAAHSPKVGNVRFYSEQNALRFARAVRRYGGHAEQSNTVVFGDFTAAQAKFVALNIGAMPQIF